MARSGSQAAWDPWTYRRDIGVKGDRGDLVGFDVEATDGHLGKIDEASNAVGSSYVVVDTGPWIFGSKVVLPAGTTSRGRPQRSQGLRLSQQGRDQERAEVRQGHLSGPGVPGPA